MAPVPRSGFRTLLVRAVLLALLPVVTIVEPIQSASLPMSPGDSALDGRAEDAAVPIFLPLIIIPPPLATWTQVNSPGFGEHAGPYTGQEAFDLTVFNDRLYLGMEGYSCARIWRSRTGVTEPAGQTDWEQVVSDGFDGKTDCAVWPPTTDNDHIDSLEPFDGCLYASTAMQTGDKRGTQVWRSTTGDAGTWVQVSEPGFGTHTNENFKDMIEYDGLLCGGTVNLDLIQPGAQVWCTDGVTADAKYPGRLLWTQRNLNGFGSSQNIEIWSSAVYDGALYFGVKASESDGSIWRTSSIDKPGSWEQVFSPSDVSTRAARVDVLQGFNGALYIGMKIQDGGAVMYRSVSGDRYTWQPASPIGFASHITGGFVSDASTSLNGSLYVSVTDREQGAGIWLTRDGITWMRTAAYGFGDSANFTAELVAFHGDVYAWTSNYAAGQGVWRGSVAP